MTAETLSEIIAIIQASKIKRERKNELTYELLNIATPAVKTAKIEPKKQCEGILSDDKELQMIVNMPGVSVSSKPKADGRFQGYILEDGKRKYFYGRSTYEVAKKIKEEVKNSKIAKKIAEKAEELKAIEKKNTPLFGEYAKNWMETYKIPNLKPKSVDTVKNAMRIPMEKFKDVPIGDITTDMLQSLLLSYKGKRVRDMSKIYLTQLFEKAKVQDVIPRNPCLALEIKKHQAAHKNALTVEQQNEFLLAVLGSKYDLLMRFLLATGLRVGEALALTREDFDFKENKVTVNKNVVWKDNLRIEQDTPKTKAGNRKIPVPSDIIYEIDTKTDTEIVFDFTYDQINHYLGRLSKDLGFRVSAHILRHTYCTRLEEAGIPERIKSKMMGHSSIQMTQNVYTDVQDSYVAKYADRITSAVKTDVLSS